MKAAIGYQPWYASRPAMASSAACAEEGSRPAQCTALCADCWGAGRGGRVSVPRCADETCL